MFARTSIWRRGEEDDLTRDAPPISIIRCLAIDQISALAMAAEEIEVEEGCWFFRQDQELHELYLVLDG